MKRREKKSLGHSHIGTILSILFSLSQITCSEGNPQLYLEDTQAILWKGLHGKELKTSAYKQQGTETSCQQRYK